jgi:hypothetical protein
LEIKEEKRSIKKWARKKKEIIFSEKSLETKDNGLQTLKE